MEGSYAGLKPRARWRVDDATRESARRVSQKTSAASRQNADINHGDRDYDARNDEQVVDRG